jgi:hypothetical protein
MTRNGRIRYFFKTFVTSAAFLRSTKSIFDIHEPTPIGKFVDVLTLFLWEIRGCPYSFVLLFCALLLLLLLLLSIDPLATRTALVTHVGDEAGMFAEAWRAKQ